jgi:metallo-beta-lactamase class B
MRSIHYYSIGLTLAVLPATLAAQDSSLVRPYTEAECSRCGEWNKPQQPLKLFGNTYYVGTTGIAAILITSPDGHVLIDVGLPDAAPQVLANVRALGFDPRDIKIILNSHAHHDHSAGIAAVQAVSGARVLASARSAPVLSSGKGGSDDPQFNVLLTMPPVRNVGIVRDNEVVKAGPLSLTMHSTPGHTPGGTSWSWQSCEGSRCLAFVYADSQTPVSDDEFRFSGDKRYPNAATDFRKSHVVLEQLQCDVLITPHPGASNMWGRLKEGAEGLVDTEGCKRLVLTARQQLADRLSRENQ